LTELFNNSDNFSVFNVPSKASFIEAPYVAKGVVIPFARIDSVPRYRLKASHEPEFNPAGPWHQYRFYNDEFAQKIRDRISTERALEQAIQNDEFIVYYQPRAFASTGEFASMEALVRWRHPVRGLISPADFIPIAEESRLIIPLGDLVIRKVCQQLAAWREQGCALKPVSINVSSLQLTDDGLRLSITKNLEHYDLPVSLVAIELTESSMLDETGIAIDELKRLHEMGIELQIDDFGT
jgi:sensor c-di-GMP phosphodiesterase-like protein